MRIARSGTLIPDHTISVTLSRAVVEPELRADPELGGGLADLAREPGRVPFVRTLRLQDQAA